MFKVIRVKEEIIRTCMVRQKQGVPNQDANLCQKSRNDRVFYLMKLTDN